MKTILIFILAMTTGYCLLSVAGCTTNHLIAIDPIAKVKYDVWRGTFMTDSKFDGLDLRFPDGTHATLSQVTSQVAPVNINISPTGAGVNVERVK